MRRSHGQGSYREPLRVAGPSPGTAGTAALPDTRARPYLLLPAAYCLARHGAGVRGGLLGELAAKAGVKGRVEQGVDLRRAEARADALVLREKLTKGVAGDGGRLR